MSSLPAAATAKEGALVFEQKACIACHGAAGLGGAGAPRCNRKKTLSFPSGKGERILPLRSPFATDGVGFHQSRAMPLGNEGTLTADEVYALTAYLLFLNKVIPEDQVLDQQSLPKVQDGRLAMITPSSMNGSPGRQGLEGYPLLAPLIQRGSDLNWTGVAATLPHPL